jgi:hypothetical protein
LPPTSNGDAVTSVDNVGRALVLLGALLYPLSDERTALEGADGEGYVAAVAARIRGVCGQSHSVMDNALKALSHQPAAKSPKKSRRNRRAAQQSSEVSAEMRSEIEAILVEYELPDALDWLKDGAHPSSDAGAPLDDLVPLAARSAAAAVRLAALAADRIDPSSEVRDGSEALYGDARERAEAVSNSTVRTAKRIARVLDKWDMQAATPTAIIGCPEPPGSMAAAGPGSGSPKDGRRSLGITAALDGDGRSVGGANSPPSAPRRQRTEPLWSSGGAVQRD